MGYTLIDMTGQHYHQWFVIKFDCVKDGRAYWICECSCGNINIVRGDNLRRGSSKRCLSCAKKGRRNG